MNRFVPANSALAKNGDGALAGSIAENASGAARRIFGAAKGDEERRAQRDPQDVDRRKDSAHSQI